MSLSVPFWNYFWHAVGLIAILLICLPTFYWQRLGKRLAVHRELTSEDVAKMRYGSRSVGQADRHMLVEAYNSANFLYHKQHVKPTSEVPVLTWEYPSRVETYALYRNGAYVDVVKATKGKKRAFTLQADEIVNWMQAHQGEDEASGQK